MDPASEEDAAQGECPQYVYGILRASAPLDLGRIGLGAPPALVRTVHEAGMAALVSESPGPRVAPTRTHLLVHQRVTEAVLREHSLLPVAFGTVLPSLARVREVLRAAREPLSRALEMIHGRLELGLKVRCHREHLARQLEVEAPALARHPAEPEGAHAHRLDAAVSERATRDMATVLTDLRPLAASLREDPPLGEHMLLNASFLVDRDEVANFEARVRALALRTEAYAFRLTGPWPPYSFVQRRLGED
ncbi:GvpL/GvpF family gas vesicle protein [Corallococcus sp. H22C18031201]|nr:GvpL/GvpF family gas vesicle protein [Citreicoccus inhibens]RJS23342.1 GvpL/GvpF family gas vesicle protein [Corallococcus sp. H22C18031201]